MRYLCSFENSLTIRRLIKSNQHVLIIVGLVISALITSLPGSFSTEALYPDGQRYLFNGLLIHDLVRDNAFSSLYQYATEYYRKYPAFNLPYGPPFLAIQFALAFAVFGIGFSVARLIVVGYTIAAAITCQYCISTIDGNRWVALIASELLLFNSLSLTYSRDIACEMPVIFFSFAALYAGYQYIELRKTGYGLAAALFLGLGYLTKQHIVPLGVGIFLYLLIGNKYSLKKTETLLAAGVIIVVTVPYTFLTMKYSTEAFGFKLFPPFSFELLCGYLKTAFYHIPVESFLALFGFIIGIRQGNRFCYLCLTLVCCWYVFFTFVYGNYIGEPRYLLVILPAIVYPGALAVKMIFIYLKSKNAQVFAIFAIILYFSWNIFHAPIFFLRGYAAAGNLIGTKGADANILFVGKYDGNFLFGIREVCPEKQAYFLRSDQWLASRRWWGELDKQAHVKDKAEILQLIRENSVGYVVVETGDPLLAEYPEYLNMQQVLRENSLFHQVAVVPINSNYIKPHVRQLEIYQSPFIQSDQKIIPLPIKPSAFQGS